MNWYVLYVRTGREPEIKAELQRQGYAAAVPIKIMMERARGTWTGHPKPVMPGYVFVSLRLTDEDYYRITDVPGVHRFLGVARPEPLTPEEADFIDWLENGGLPLTESDVLLQPEQPAKIMSGPLRGREGLIVWINPRQRRACVAITVGGQRKEFTLSINVLRVTEAPKL